MPKEGSLFPCRFTEADLRMYPTIIRYDGCYATLFKCSKKRISDFPNLSAWLRDVYQLTVKDSPTLQVRIVLHMGAPFVIDAFNALHTLPLTALLWSV